MVESFKPSNNQRTTVGARLSVKTTRKEKERGRGSDVHADLSTVNFSRAEASRSLPKPICMRCQFAPAAGWLGPGRGIRTRTLGIEFDTGSCLHGDYSVYIVTTSMTMYNAG